MEGARRARVRDRLGPHGYATAAGGRTVGWDAYGIVFTRDRTDSGPLFLLFFYSFINIRVEEIGSVRRSSLGRIASVLFDRESSESGKKRFERPTTVDRSDGRLPTDPSNIVFYCFFIYLHYIFIFLDILRTY